MYDPESLTPGKIPEYGSRPTVFLGNQFLLLRTSIVVPIIIPSCHRRYVM